jgi:hypothetical protein
MILARRKAVLKLSCFMLYVIGVLVIAKRVFRVSDDLDVSKGHLPFPRIDNDTQNDVDVALQKLRRER